MPKASGDILQASWESRAMEVSANSILRVKSKQVVGSQLVEDGSQLRADFKRVKCLRRDARLPKQAEGQMQANCKQTAS